MLEINESLAIFGDELVEDVAADFALEGHGAQRETLVAATGGHRKGGEGFGANFLPSGRLNGRQKVVFGEDSAVDDAGYTEIGNAGDVGEALDRGGAVG